MFRSGEAVADETAACREDGTLKVGAIGDTDLRFRGIRLLLEPPVSDSLSERLALRKISDAEREDTEDWDSLWIAPFALRTSLHSSTPG